MKLKRFSFFLFFTFLLCDVLLAQSTVASSYFCDFEDAVENEKWELKVGLHADKCANKWYIGKPGSANNGENGLYVSCDNGLTSDYTNKAVMVMAYREITLEAGDYELSFDWKAGGAEFNDGLYVCLAPTSDRDVRLASATSSVLENWVKIRPDGYALDFGSDNICLNQRYWNTVVDSINISANESYYLIFIWRNGTLTPYSSGACIDNIMITPKGACNRPTDFRVNPIGTDLLLSWTGDADAYDVQIYDYETETWSEYKDIKEKYLELKGLSEGMKSFFVRSVCGDVHSAWTSRDKFFYHSTSVSCIDFLNLTSQNCYTNTFKNLGKGPRTPGVVDNGSLSVYSHHTIHWNKNERDPRTGNGKDNGLKTVPDGELASVRIGGAKAGGEIEEIEYNLYVDENSAVLLLNYAVVLEYHEIQTETHTNASFALEIRDGGKPLDAAGCGEADFTAGKITPGKDGWNLFAPGDFIPVQWKDWTTVAIDLRKYIGRSLTITISTKDCTSGGHWGYAYFTLKCTDGKIQSLTCGNSGEKSKFLAPEGFKYRWYDPNNPSVTLSTNREFEIDADDVSTYYVDIIQPTNDDCFFTEHVSGVGRWPHAKADYKLDIKNCENNVIFENQSFIQLINQVTDETSSTGDKCDVFFWDFGDGDTSIVENPVHRYPDEGGTYTVRLKAAITGGCESDTSFVITLPKLGTDTTLQFATICEKDYYPFNTDTLYEAGIYVDSLKNIYGCDSLVILDLSVVEKFDTTIYDTICSSDVYIYQGRVIDETGLYTFALKSKDDCDSIVNLDIVVYEPLFVSIEDESLSACADDENLVIHFGFDENKSVPVDFSIVFDSLASRCGFENQENLKLADFGDSFTIALPENCRPNSYTATLIFKDTTGVCGDLSIPVVFDVYYSASILQPKFDNLITILNEQANGGYVFETDSFKWYKNGQLLDSVNSAYYFLPGDEIFTEEDCYYVELMRKDDGVVMRSCEICPGTITPIVDTYGDVDFIQTTIIEKGGHILLENIDEALVDIYTFTGVLVSSQMIDSDNAALNVPNEVGFYIVKVKTENRIYVYKIWIK